MLSFPLSGDTWLLEPYLLIRNSRVTSVALRAKYACFDFSLQMNDFKEFRVSFRVCWPFSIRRSVRKPKRILCRTPLLA